MFSGHDNAYRRRGKEPSLHKARRDGLSRERGRRGSNQQVEYKKPSKITLFRLAPVIGRQRVAEKPEFVSGKAWLRL
jgi:hypothetical protein